MDRNAVFRKGRGKHEEDLQINRQELKRLAEFSTRHAEQLQKLKLTEAEARRDRELLEWCAEFSTDAADELRELQRKEARECNGVTPAELFAESLLEQRWDPNKHPRLGRSPNAGWWAKAGAGGQTGKNSAGSSTQYLSTKGDSPDSSLGQLNDLGRLVSSQANTPTKAAETSQLKRTLATTVSHRSGTGVPIQLAALARQGHHWVPQAVFGRLASRMTARALAVFKSGTKDTGFYSHAFDTWNGVTHDVYNSAVETFVGEMGRFAWWNAWGR
jgi:hypothetical protein